MHTPTAIADRDGMVIVTGKADLVQFNDDLYGDVDGGGFENVAAQDVAIPYLRILQALSGEVKRGSPKKVEGAEEGDIFNTGTGTVHKGGITVIPCLFKKSWILHRPRTLEGKLGDFITVLSSEPTGTKVGRSFFDSEGNEAVDVADHYVVLVDGSTWSKALIRMGSTQLKASRFWLGRMQGIQWIRNNARVTPPSFSHYYHLTTGLETKGENSWMGWIIGTEHQIMDMQLAMYAKEFYKAIIGGTVQVAAHETELDTAAETVSAAGII